MTALLILGIILLLLLGLLFLPIELYLDTTKNQYYVQLKGVARASFEEDEEALIKIRLNILFRNFYVYPLRKRSPGTTKSGKKKKVKRRFGRKSLRKILKLLQSFEIRKLVIDIDTGDYLLNAKLYPLFAFLNYLHGGFNINFYGTNKMVLYLRGRPIYILKSIINT